MRKNPLHLVTYASAVEEDTFNLNDCKIWVPPRPELAGSDVPPSDYILPGGARLAGYFKDNILYVVDGTPDETVIAAQPLLPALPR